MNSKYNGADLEAVLDKFFSIFQKVSVQLYGVPVGATNTPLTSETIDRMLASGDVSFQAINIVLDKALSLDDWKNLADTLGGYQDGSTPTPYLRYVDASATSTRFVFCEKAYVTYTNSTFPRASLSLTVDIDHETLPVSELWKSLTRIVLIGNILDGLGDSLNQIADKLNSL